MVQFLVDLLCNSLYKKFTTTFGVGVWALNWSVVSKLMIDQHDASPAWCLTSIQVGRHDASQSVVHHAGDTPSYRSTGVLVYQSTCSLPCRRGKYTKWKDSIRTAYAECRTQWSVFRKADSTYPLLLWRIPIGVRALRSFVNFHKGLPTPRNKIFDRRRPSLLIIDDLMDSVNEFVANICTRFRIIAICRSSTFVRICLISPSIIERSVWICTILCCWGIQGICSL